MKKSLIIILPLLLLLTFGSLNYSFGLDISSSDTGFGFQNGSYIYFRDPISLSYVEQIASSNASYPDWMFFQKQGSNDVFGFWSNGVNVTINSFFASNIIELDCVGAGTVKVQGATYGAPVSISGASGVYDNTLQDSIITITSSVVVQLVWGSSPVPTPPPQGGGGGGGATPTPVPTANPSSSNPTPTPKPLGINDFIVDDINLEKIQTNTTVFANLHFRFSGSSNTLQTISFPEPFDGWYVPNGNFSSLVYMLNPNGESSGDVVLRFDVGTVDSQGYSGSFTVTSKDAFGATHTSTGTIAASSTNSFGGFDVIGFFRSNPLYIVLISVAVGVLLFGIVKFTKRRP